MSQQGRNEEPAAVAPVAEGSVADAQLAVVHAADGRSPTPDDLLWHRGWIVGTVACAALLLVAVGGVSAQVLLSLFVMAIPGIVGAVWRPKREETFALAALWALGAALTACVTGGLSGPAAVFCVLPVIAAVTLDYSLRSGLGLSVAAVAVCALAGALHLLPPPPLEPVRNWLTLAAVMVTACAAGGAALIARRRADAAQAAVQEDVLWFEGLMADLPELAMTMDADGRTEAVFGQPFEGFGADALQGGLVAAASAADAARVEAALTAALTTGAAEVAFTPAQHTDFRVIAKLQRTGPGGLAAVLRKAPAIVRAAPPSMPTTPVPGPVAAVQPPSDFTERLAAAEAGRDAAETGRQRAEATAASRALFLANMSHELRTPLNAIMGFSDMMRARMFGELTPKYAEYAELIHESGGHLLDLINDVLDMSKIEAQRYTLSRELFDVREALNAALRLMRLQADDAGVKLRAVLPSEPLTVDADRRALKQMVLNLLSNAVKFTPKDGSVILTAQAAAGVLEIVVGDTGVGIAEADLKRLGQPFEQAGKSEDRARGTGLGLSLVDAFAKLHGGTMTLESRLGEGTAVTVRMPVLVKAEPVEPVEPVGYQPPAVPAAFAPQIAPQAAAKPLAPISTFTPLSAILAANDVGAFGAVPPRLQRPSSEVAASEVSEPAHLTPAHLNEAPVAIDDTRSTPDLAPEVEATPEPEPASSPAPMSEPPAAPPEASPTTAVSDALGPLHTRAVEHHGLKQSVLSLFSRPATLPASSEEPPPDPKPPGPKPPGPKPPGPDRPSNGGISVLG